MIKLVLILTLVSNLSWAQNAVYLEKNHSAPFSGDLLTLDQTKSLYNDSLNASNLQKQLDLEQQNNQLLTQENTILQTQNDKLVKQDKDQKSLSELEKWGYFALGVLFTAAAVKGAASLHP